MPLASAGNPIGIPFIELQSVDSTNKYAMGLVHAGMAQHGMAIFTPNQTAGKGQRGRSWSSEPGSNIALSIILNPYPLRISEGFRLSACVAVAVLEFLKSLAGDNFKIKWPNDLYWRDRKAGGILIENRITTGDTTLNNWQWAVAGIGLNINQTVFPEDLPNPVSLKQITGKGFSLTDLTKQLCRFLDKGFQSLVSGHFTEILNRYNEELYKKGESVKLKTASGVFDVFIDRVSETGQLVTRHATKERFNHGEVTWLIQDTGAADQIG